jgi:hypothetical protein
MLNKSVIMVYTKEATVVADSGVSVPVQVLDNEVIVYEGDLSATFPVQKGHAYILGIPAGLWLLEKLKILLETKFNTIFVVSFNALLVLGGFAVMLAVYFICLSFSGCAIDRVVPAEALKIEG